MCHNSVVRLIITDIVSQFLVVGAELSKHRVAYQKYCKSTDFSVVYHVTGVAQFITSYGIILYGGMVGLDIVL